MAATREECGRHRARDARKRLHWFAWFGPLRAHAALVHQRDLVRAGGMPALMNGVGPRVVRVFIEVGLQFSLYEVIGRQLDRLMTSSKR